MPPNFFQRIDLEKLYPQFKQLVVQLQLNCQARGVDYWAISGLRTWEEQTKLYALGRTIKNNDSSSIKPMGSIVTKARAGTSYHNFGIAVDFCPDKDKVREGLQPDWNKKAYQILVEEASKLGLEAGGSWKSFPDYPHIQLKISEHKLNLAILSTQYNKNGMFGVWALLDKYQWTV